jgi:hypothetical protein
MALTTRQTNLLVAEDWTKVYQSFRNADFQAYDYETLRKSMIDYLRLYYPEDFNDFIESSEYIALIDLIAFLGQSIAFRADLNARENFIDTAERRDSILRLAKLVSYVPQRNINAVGLLKIDTVSTTEALTDSDGVDLTNANIYWNDNTNANWYEQFVTIINSALISGQRIGNPGNSQYLTGIKTDEYGINLAAGGSNIYKFKSTVQGVSMSFEAVSGTSIGQNYIYESSPAYSSVFNLIARNDNLGNASNNTGFFVMFKQGTLQSDTFNLAESLSNRVLSVSSDNINNTDYWLYQLSNSGNPITEWLPVPSVNGTNIAYNQVNATNRDIFEVGTRANDQVDLIFGDGTFANIPQGNFTFYYRTSNNLDYRITPAEVNNIQINIPYTSKSNRSETLTLTVSLKYTVSNARARETLASIKTNAPQQYYTQNRMVNGEDYNILPFTKFSNLVKVKAVNRTSSGISRFLDVLDTTGKYSSTNIFCQDGILSKADTFKTFTFEWTTVSDIQQAIETKILPVIESQSMKNFYYYYFNRYALTNTFWTAVTLGNNSSTGYFQSGGIPWQIGNTVTGSRAQLIPGAIIKFYAGSGKYFDANHVIQNGTPSAENESQYLYSAVRTVDKDGTYTTEELNTYGVGPVALSDIVPSDAEAVEVISDFADSLTSAVRQSIVDNVEQNKNFGLGYDTTDHIWYVISASNLNTAETFSETYRMDTTNSHLDNSWILTFTTSGTSHVYTVKYRGMDYYFESELETRFYFDKTQRSYDAKVGTVVKDNIKILKVNNKPDSSLPLVTPVTVEINDNVIGQDGYVNNEIVKVTFADPDNDGLPNNPDFFQTIVDPTTNPDSKKVYYEILSSGDYAPIASTDIVLTYATLAAIQANKTKYVDGTLFYASTDDKFYTLSVNGSVRTVSQVTNYAYRTGRQNIYFQYRHNSPNNRRIDPAPNNIIDLYLLTKTYSDDYYAWLADVTGSVMEPEEPSSEDLRLNFQELESYKMISDTIIYNTAKFRPLFGTKAETALQAKFKIVKNPITNISDTEIKSRVLTALNTYFSIDNWDFGETFYFTELSAYLHTSLATYISSVILVPQDVNQQFGDLFQVNANIDEIFVNSATAADIEIISAITAAQLNQV